MTNGSRRGVHVAGASRAAMTEVRAWAPSMSQAIGREGKGNDT